VKVEVQLFATLAGYLPEAANGDRVILDMPARSTVMDLKRSLGIPDALECMTVVNGRDVPPEHPLDEGDVLSMFPPLAGG
jgi:molybdopterin converting factor small subunit